MTAERKPVNVQIVRPYMRPLETFFFLFFYGSFHFLSAWILMLIAGTVTDWHLAYWHTLLALIGLRMVQVGSNYAMWTKAGSK